MFTMRCLFVHVQEYCTRSTHVKNVLPIVKQFIVYNVVAVYEGTFVLSYCILERVYVIYYFTCTVHKN